MCNTHPILKVLQINLNRCEAAALAMQRVVIDLKIDIVLIQEPLYYHNIQVVPYIPRGFAALHSMNEAKGGALILARSSLSSLSKLRSTHTATGISFRWAGEWVNAVSIYARPMALTQAADLTTDFFAANPDMNISDTIIGMDANALNPLWNSVKTDKAGEDLAAMVNITGLNIVNREVDKSALVVPTQFPDVTLAGDAIMANIGLWTLLDIPSVSDHPYLYYEIKGKIAAASKRSHMWLPREEDVNISAYTAAVSSALNHHRPPLANSADIDTEVAWLSSLITRSSRSSAKTSRKPHTKQMEWWTKELYSLRNTLRLAAKKYARDRTAANREEIGHHKRRYQRKIRETRTAAITALRAEFSNRDPHGALKVLTCSKLPPINTLTVNGVTSSDPSAIALALGRHFFTSDEPPLTAEQQSIKSSTEDFLTSDAETPFHLITSYEIDAAIKKIVKRKSAGIDGVQGWQLHALKHLLKDPLVNLLNACLLHSHFPDSWKVGRIVFLLKKEKDDQLAASYRPISILPLLGKVFERILKARILHLAIEGTWFDDSQHGFMPGRSTITAAYTLTSAISNNAYGHNYWETLACLLDIKGAFDNAWHPAIINELIKDNCPRYLIRLMANFLTNRMAVIRKAEAEHPFQLFKGCPQGSVLSPLLWNLLLNSGLQLINNGSDQSIRKVYCIAYADDILLYNMTKSGKRGKTKKSLNAMQAAVDAFSSWCTANRLAIAPLKTEFILFSKKVKRDYVTDLSIKVGDHIVKQSLEVCYLGFVLDRQNNWHSHIEKACTNGQKANLLINRLARSSWGADRHTLNVLYRTVAIPTLTYGCALWAEGIEERKSHKERILSTYRLMALGAIKGYHSVSKDAALIIANWLPLDQEIDLIAAKFSLQQLRKHEQERSRLPEDSRRWFHPPQLSKKAASTLAAAGVTSRDFPKLITSTHDTLNIWSSSIISRSASPLGKLPPWSTIRSRLSADFTGDQCPNMHPLHKDTVHIFTDGSCASGKVGASTILCTSDAPDVETKLGLPQHSTAFEAEIAALRTAVEQLTRKQDPRWKRAIIFSDSQAALKAICSSAMQYPDVNAIQDMVLSQTALHSIRFTWVKAHRGNAGNERADQLAKEAAELPPSRELTFSSCEIIRRCRRSALEKWEASWLSSIKGRWTFKFIPNLALARVLAARKLTHEMCQVLTGHAGLNGYLAMRKVISSDQCECLSNAETMEHFLFLCHSHHKHRIAFHNACLHLTGQWPPPFPSFIEDQRLWIALASFVTKTGRLSRRGRTQPGSTMPNQPPDPTAGPAGLRRQTVP